MKLHLILISFLVLFQSAHAQSEKKANDINSSDVSIVSFEPVYFILGTLNDYNGRFHSVGKGKQVDKYYSYEKPLVNYLTRFIRSELGITVDTISEKSNIIRMYSDELSKTLNDLYGEEERLQNEKFKTEHQIYSFLSGMYYRYGEKLDSSIYKIQLANSPKHQNCYDFLKQIACENIFYQYLRNIPAQYILYFEPTDTLKQYLDSIKIEKGILKESYVNQIEEMINNSMSKEDMERNICISKENELLRIRNAFKR